MLDTVGLRSPEISEFEAYRIEHYLQSKYAINNSTGEEVYCIVAGSLPGSFTSSISVRVKREDFVTRSVNGKSVTDVEKCGPYLRIEGSVHKALQGHNVFGGPLEPVSAVRWFLADVGGRLGIELPSWDTWVYERVDWSEVFDLGSFEACEEYLGGMVFARYPRRKVLKYGRECVLFPGTTTATKAYHKGPEFAKNSHREFSAFFGQDSATLLQRTANNFLRFEVSIKSKKLQADFGKKPSVVMLKREYLETLHDREIARIIREGKQDMETVRNNEDVRRRLYSVYGQRLGNTLFGTWSALVMVGEDSVRESMSRPTFYRQRQQLQAACVAWVGTDVIVRESCIPQGFSPVRSDPRRLVTEAPEVSAALMAFAV